jgi:hypothetical protein
MHAVQQSEAHALHRRPSWRGLGRACEAARRVERSFLRPGDERPTRTNAKASGTAAAAAGGLVLRSLFCRLRQSRLLRSVMLGLTNLAQGAPPTVRHARGRSALRRGTLEEAAGAAARACVNAMPPSPHHRPDRYLQLAGSQ